MAIAEIRVGGRPNGKVSLRADDGNAGCAESKRAAGAYGFSVGGDAVRLSAVITAKSVIFMVLILFEDVCP
jgi:hypothetical protein